MTDTPTPAGFVDGVLHCYGGCGRRYRDFGLDVLLPTPLWNQIAVGAPFGDEPLPSDAGEGRGGVLCAQCIVDRLSHLNAVSAAFIDIVDHRDEDLPPRQRADIERALEHAGVEFRPTPLPDRIWQLVIAVRDLRARLDVRREANR